MVTAAETLMPVISLNPGYRGDTTDRVENFGGLQLLYLQWEDHLQYCSPITIPISPTLTFGELLDNVLPATTFASDAEWAAIDWSRTEWRQSHQQVSLDRERSLADLGIGHKAFLSFRTAFLNTDAAGRN